VLAVGPATPALVPLLAALGPTEARFVNDVCTARVVLGYMHWLGTEGYWVKAWNAASESAAAWPQLLPELLDALWAARAAFAHDELRAVHALLSAAAVAAFLATGAEGPALAPRGRTEALRAALLHVVASRVDVVAEHVERWPAVSEVCQFQPVNEALTAERWDPADAALPRARTALLLSNVVKYMCPCFHPDAGQLLQLDVVPAPEYAAACLAAFAAKPVAQRRLRMRVLSLLGFPLTDAAVAAWLAEHEHGTIAAALNCAS
jgi:hypothetical protein